MGDCGSSLNCTVSEDPVASDPDVAGIGVLVSFVASAALTFIAIVVGYLSDSLPDATLSPLDRAILAKISKTKWRPWPKKGPLRVSLQRSTSTLLAWAGVSSVFNADPIRDPGEMRLRDRERRSKGLERFVLALSDQQLVTGLAVLIAAYINRCTMSLYHFNIVAALAWFSSTTHLSTLAVLRVYLIDHPRVRNWRVAAMLGVLGPLSVAQFGAMYTSSNNCLPVQCVFESAWPTPLDPSTMAQASVIIIFLVTSFGTNITRLYSLDPDWSVRYCVVEFLVRKFSRRARESTRAPHLGMIIISSSKRLKSEQRAAFRKLEQRRRLVHQVKLTEGREMLMGRSFKFTFLTRELSNAFLDDLLTSLFGITFGIAQVIVNWRNMPAAVLSGSQNSMGFGQLVPLILMILPACAAGEVYFGKMFSKLLSGKLSNEALYIERYDHATSEPLHKPAPWIVKMNDIALLTDEYGFPVPIDQGHPLQQPVEPCSTSAMGTNLLQSDISNTSCDVTNNLCMDNLSAMGQSPASGVTTASTNITPVGRADTESGLRFTQCGRTSSLRGCQASGPGEWKDNGIGAKGKVPRTPGWWTAIVMHLTIRAIFYALFAISVAGIGSPLGFLTAMLVRVAMVLSSIASDATQVSRDV